MNSVILHNLTLQRVSIPSSFVILYNALNTLVYLRCCSTGSLWKYIIPLEISVPYKHNVSVQCCSALSYSSDEICVVWKNSKLNSLKWRDVFGYYTDRARCQWAFILLHAGKKPVLPRVYFRYLRWDEVIFTTALGHFSYSPRTVLTQSSCWNRYMYKERDSETATSHV